jgi:hypothetical protein
MPIDTSKKLRMMNFSWIPIILAHFIVQTYSFAPIWSMSIPQYQPITTSRSASSAENIKPPEKFPPLTKEEIMEILDRVPVYAVTEVDQEGLVLLKEKDNPNDLAYFFFSAETANEVFAPIRAKKQEASWAVTEYSLGVVWFELFKDPEPGIEYRFIPDGRNLGGARQLIEEQSKQLGASVPGVFQKAYNQIPVFIDQFLRIQTPDGVEQFPLYLGIQDMITTCQQAAAVTSGKYEAAINVADLDTLIAQMQSESENNFRKAVFIPPSPTSASLEQSVSMASFSSDDTPLSTPTAVDLWDD